MANVKFVNHSITEDDIRLLVNLFKDPLLAKLFIDFIGVVKGKAKHEMEKTSQAFLLNNDPITRALALQQKGKVELLTELTTLIQTVVK